MKTTDTRWAKNLDRLQLLRSSGSGRVRCLVGRRGCGCCGRCPSCVRQPTQRRRRCPCTSDCPWRQGRLSGMGEEARQGTAVRSSHVEISCTTAVQELERLQLRSQLTLTAHSSHGPHPSRACTRAALVVSPQSQRRSTTAQVRRRSAMAKKDPGNHTIQHDWHSRRPKPTIAHATVHQQRLSTKYNGHAGSNSPGSG